MLSNVESDCGVVEGESDMGQFDTNHDEVDSIVAETPVDDLTGPAGVLEAVQLYDASAQYYAEATGSYESSAVVVSSTSAVPPW
jgi:hypothetical protein